MAIEQLAHYMPHGAARFFVIQKNDINGNLLDPPPRFELSLLKLGFDNVREIKGQHGKYAVAVDMTTGKETPKLKGEMFNHDIEQINAMFYGGDIVSGADLHHTETFAVPTGSVANYKINNVKTLFLGGWSSHTSATRYVAGSWVSMSEAASATAPAAGEIGTSGGKYYFHKSDIGKSVKITWVCVGGATVVSEFKVPVIRNGYSSIDMALFYRVSSVKKGAATWTKDTYNTTAVAPATTHYMCSTNGNLIFNSSDTGSITVAHTTDQISVSSVIATLPSAGYKVIIDPPGLANYLSTESIKLITDAGTAMTGVAVGEFLELITSGSPTTGQAKSDADGIITFSSDDALDVVQIKINQDFYWKTITPPNNGDFIKHLSVKVQEPGKAPVEMRQMSGSASSLDRNEYTIDANGTVYFSGSNEGQTVFYSYLYHTDEKGRTLAYENHEMGVGIELECIIDNTDGVNHDTISGIRAMAKHHKLDGNEGDKSKTDVEFELFASEDGKIYTWSSSVDSV